MPHQLLHVKLPEHEFRAAIAQRNDPEIVLMRRVDRAVPDDRVWLWLHTPGHPLACKVIRNEPGQNTILTKL